MLKINIPKDINQIKQQIKALEYAIKNDNDKDRQIHQEALNELRKASEVNKY